MSKHWKKLVIGLGIVALIGILIWQFINPITAAYNWFWGVFLGLPHPFTWYMRESAKAHPMWWILIPVFIKVLLLTFYWAVLYRRALKNYLPVHYFEHLREFVRDNALTILFIPWVIEVGWWFLVTHLWGLI